MDWGKVPMYFCHACRWHGRIASNYREIACPQCGKDGLREGSPTAAYRKARRENEVG